MTGDCSCWNPIYIRESSFQICLCLVGKQDVESTSNAYLQLCLFDKSESSGVVVLEMLYPCKADLNKV